MPLPINFRLLPLATQVNLRDVIGDDPDQLIVWFYTYIQKNSRAETQPNVRVAFRKIEQNELSDQIVYRSVPITSLGQLRIGSVWQNGFCRAQAEFEGAEVEVNFSSSGWRHTSFQNVVAPPFEWNIYPPSRFFTKDKNQFLEFNMVGGRRLIVPCLEFFYRCYGRSAEIKRVLVTYPWHGSNEPHLSKLYAELDEIEEDGKWKVKLRKRLVLDDVMLLAHAKYESYTENALKGIYSQIASEFDQRQSPFIFLKVKPWHQGSAKLKVKGIRLSDGSFLALQIVGCSDPKGTLIERDREDMSRSDDVQIEDQDDGEYFGGHVRLFRKSRDIVDLTGSEEPDHGSGSAEVIDTDFVVVGRRRVVIDVRRTSQMEGGAGGRNSAGGGISPTVVSGGEPYGSGKDVGQALIYAKQVMETHGMLRDMWNAMLYLRSQRPATVRSVEWLSRESEFNSDPEPILIALTPFEEDDEVDSKTRNWLYLDVKSKTPRGVLVARLQIEEKAVFIVEIERRTRCKQKINDSLQDLEESFRGLVFVPDQDQTPEKWLPKLLYAIKKEIGVVKKITGSCPGIADTFKHSSSGGDEIACQASVVNALKKMGVRLD